LASHKSDDVRAALAAILQAAVPDSVTGVSGHGHQTETAARLTILPAIARDDSERLSRLECEAKVLASLNHGKIAAIYGLVDPPSRGFAPP